MKRLLVFLASLGLLGIGSGCVSSELNHSSEVLNLEVDEHGAIPPEEKFGKGDGPAVGEGRTPTSGRVSGAPRSNFDWPVNEARLTRGFFLKPKKKRGRPHLGIDLAAGKGTPIYSAHSGLVIYVGREFKGYGRMIMIEGQEGIATLYAHLSKALVRAGTHVEKGELLGEMGRTGRATGVHLHFEIRMKDGPVDPLNYLPGGGELLRQAARSIQSLKIPLWIWPELLPTTSVSAAVSHPPTTPWIIPHNPSLTLPGDEL